jgi:hypothetical protein
MIERLLSFASLEANGDDPDGTGLPGGHYGAVAIGAEEKAAAWIGSGPEGEGLSSVPVQRGEGTLRVGSDVVLGLAARTSALSFEIDEQRSVTVQAIEVSADLGDNDGFEGIGVSWTLSGLTEASALRTVWAALGDQGLLVLFGLRDRDASEHGAETLGAARIGRDGAVTSYSEPLLSTEYDGAGRQIRATLELWGEDEEAFAERGGGLRSGGGEAEVASAELRAAGFRWRVDGQSGIGGYEIVST